MKVFSLVNLIRLTKEFIINNSLLITQSNMKDTSTEYITALDQLKNTLIEITIEPTQPTLKSNGPLTMTANILLTIIGTMQQTILRTIPSNILVRLIKTTQRIMKDCMHRTILRTMIESLLKIIQSNTLATLRLSI